uniref:class I SAM-dependent methyltransferase n=1 Tax=Sinomicrobium oceani TaxID=1150368 RepID=UPI00227BB2C7
IEHALSKVPGIKQSAVIAKERHTDTGTTKYLVGYYVLDHGYTSGRDADVLESWENLYDSEYEKTIGEENIASDFTGWNSYITEEAIPLPEMHAWRDDIVASINALQPSNVLEIGIGSGLLMYPLLKDIKRYVGLDISNQVVDRHKKLLEDQNYNVELYHLRADQIDQLPKKERYDTIIVNSVCQYFPSIQYFDDMLDKVIPKLSDNGHIFLGDIRNYALHKELIKEKLEYNGESYAQQDIDRAALRENELLIAPNYFVELKNRYKNIKIRILERNGGYTNELSKYRYDVVISVPDPKKVQKDSGNHLPKKGAKHYNIPFLNQISKEDILGHITRELPEYMIPAA